MDPFIGEIRLYPYKFAPRNWAPCDGRLLQVIQYAPLFSLLSTQFGGDGRSTFGLPNFIGALPMGTGQMPGSATNWRNGQATGSATVTLTALQLPMHVHALTATSAMAVNGIALGQQLAQAVMPGAENDDKVLMYSSAPPDTLLAPSSLTPAGGGQAHANAMPSLAFIFCIALQGIWPQRP